MTGADPDILARALLRERQGVGARYDAPTAPAADLLLARRGTAYFARQLNGLTDAELTGPSGIAGWARSRIVVGVAFQARWLARLAAAARLDLEVETIVDPELFLEDIELAATLPAHALRYLFQHSGVHLNVEWRDLRMKVGRALYGRWTAGHAHRRDASDACGGNLEGGGDPRRELAPSDIRPR